ncbi:alpha/beta fold hydrolase [Solibacillus sp. FSL W7-1464]|uniref:alpha/beta hydrolase n=1 Tax=Solibacillus sp. FSL W7-1464 TaxID=2921706 RepID=UPI0030FCA331
MRELLCYNIVTNEKGITMQHLVEDIYLQGNRQAFLLLHSFTSNAKEMHYVAKMLHSKGYTCYAPNLAGHGASPEQLFASSMEHVWEHSRQAVQYLIEEKYEAITVIGQSLGGVLGIRLANEFPEVKALCIISSPVMERPVEGLEQRVIYYSKRYLQNRGSSEQELEVFLADNFPRPVEKMRALQQFIVETGNQLHLLKQPLFLAKGMLDESVFHQSIDMIEQSAQSNMIMKKHYDNSSHLITLGKERQLLTEDIIRFIDEIKKGAV